jgi:uncharacterized protein (DUF433 family)
MTSRPKAITRDPDIQGGAPVFAGTRVLVQIFLDCRRAGKSVDEFLAQYPSVSRELAEAALDEIRANRQPFRRRVFRLMGTSVEILSWGPPEWAYRGRAINVRGLSWEVETRDGKLATARFGWRLPRSIWHVDLTPRIRLDVCSDHSARLSAAKPRTGRKAAVGKVNTAYDRMFESKMQNPEWAAGYEAARARLDQSPTEPPKPRRRITRWEDIRRSPRPR